MKPRSHKLKIYNNPTSLSYGDGQNVISRQPISVLTSSAKAGFLSCFVCKPREMRRQTFHSYLNALLFSS